MTFPREQLTAPESVNIDGRRLAKVVDRFRTQQSSGLFPGGQLALRRNGKLVVNEACGISRGLRPGEEATPIEVDSRTPFPVLSAGKPLAAIAVAMLEDRGALDVEAPVSTIIPGFAAHGKAGRDTDGDAKDSRARQPLRSLCSGELSPAPSTPRHRGGLSCE